MQHETTQDRSERTGTSPRTKLTPVLDIRVRKSEDRGQFDHGWLDTKHTFSFADYYDPDYMGFSALRVINEDRVQPRQGFPMHGHRDMEILTYVIEGRLAHKDSMGNGSMIQAGEFQRMTAGTGVRHSEVNASEDETVHLLQIWILPEKQGLEPGYEQKTFSYSERHGSLRLVASRDAAQGSILIHQDVRLYSSILTPAQNLTYDLAPWRNTWVQVVRGSLRLRHASGEPIELTAGDGAAVSRPGEATELTLTGASAGVGSHYRSADETEILVFDLP